MNHAHPSYRFLFIKHASVTVAVMAGTVFFDGAALAEKHHFPNAPDSFLKYQVDSTSELVEALRSDETLRHRYGKHFAIPENQVLEFVKNALVPYRLPSDQMVTTYGISKSGRVYGVRNRMRKGTKVWANRSGVPILKWLCANPLTKTLPGTKMAKARQTTVKSGTKVAGVPQLAPIDSEMPLPFAEESLRSLFPQTSTALTTLNVPVAVAALPATRLTPPASTSTGNNYGVFFPIGLILLSSLTGSGGSAGTGGASSSAGPPPIGPVAAPEPGSVALLLPIMGTLGITMRRRRK